MRHGPFIFVGVLFTLACSFALLVLAPQVQLGAMLPVSIVGEETLYPAARPGAAAQGAQVYRANGCVACHSQQVRQKDTEFTVILTATGTNTPAVIGALLKSVPRLSADQAAVAVTNLPFTLAEKVSLDAADAVAKPFTGTGATTVQTFRHIGLDMDRGWGRRRSVARDYLLDETVMLGSMRLGPDLANVGARSPGRFAAPWRIVNMTNAVEEATAWHLLHLYNPRVHAPGSTMPGYPWLFEERAMKNGKKSGEALGIPEPFAPAKGMEIVPRQSAKALVAYLLSLRAEASLPELEVKTEAKPAATATAPTAAATNTPAAKQ